MILLLQVVGALSIEDHPRLAGNYAFDLNGLLLSAGREPEKTSTFNDTFDYIGRVGALGVQAEIEYSEVNCRNGADIQRYEVLQDVA